MLSVKIEGISELKSYLSVLRKEEIPKAFEITINKTLKQMQARFEEAVKEKFDRPTSYAIKSTFIDPIKVNKNKYSAGIRIKDKATKKPQIEVLGHHVIGGSRHHKAYEGWMIANGHMKPDQFIVPGPHAKKNSYGNQTRKEISDIIKALSETGKIGAWRVFISDDGKTVFSVKGQNVKLLWFIVDKVQYSERYQYFDIGKEQANKKLLENADYAISKAIKYRNP